MTTGHFSATGSILQSVRNRSVYSKVLKCSVNFKHMSNPGKASGMGFKVNFMLNWFADKGYNYECQRNITLNRR